jgi:putative flippase GtrA
MAFPRGWMLSAAANVMSTFSSFILHNAWTFSDRQHKGLRLLRGFLLFACMAVIGIFITAWIYVGLMRISAHLAVVSSHPGNNATPLICQLVAVLLVAAVSFLFNLTFTWPRTPANASGEAAQVQKL